MNYILDLLKKIGLFLFGVVLVIWGYGANLATAKKEASGAKGSYVPLIKDIEGQLKQQQDSLVNKKDVEKRAKENVLPKKNLLKKEISSPIIKEEPIAKISEEPKTVIEPEKSEESSGTE